MSTPSSGVAAENGILAIWNDCADGRDGEFETWFQSEHLAERLAVPGFLFGRRHEAIAGTPRYFVFYVTETPATLTSAPYMERLNNPTPMTHKVMSEIFRNMSRTVCRRTMRVGQFRGATTVTLRFGERPDAAKLASLMQTLAQDSDVASAELWLAADAGVVTMTEEERLRGGDRKIQACLAIDTLRAREAEAIAARLAAQFPTAETGVYRVLCQIGRGDI